MINMQNFGKVAMNKDGSVTVGSGATFEQLVDVVGKAGRELSKTHPVPHTVTLQALIFASIAVGACPCVGTMGAMLGGGLGRLQGLHGLTSDALRHVRMATWNGRLVEASEKVNPDLFWGLRGAGQNFGIVVEATYETWPATSGGMQYSADLVFPLTSLEHVWDTTNEILKRGIDPALALMLAVGSDGTTLQTVILVNIVYAGAEAKGKRYAAMYAAGSNASLTEQVTPWTNLSNVALPQVVRAGCARGRRANQYSVMTKTLPTATFRAAADSYSQFVRAHPAANTSVIFIETFGQAALAQLPADSTAFPHRHAFANAVVLSMTYNARADVGSLAADADGWARGWRDRIATVSGYDRLSVYQNYAHDDEPLSALYGYEPWRHQRLSALKAKYDPRGHFNGFHAVPADVSAWS